MTTTALPRRLIDVTRPIAEAMTPAQRQALFPRIPYSPHAPTPQQAAFLALTTREGFYGGAAGGGKSDALLMAALQYVEVPGYTALLLRKNYADLALPGALMDRLGDWLRPHSDVKERDGGKRWEFPSGAVIQFGHMDKPRDRYRYQGAELQFVGWDEVTQFTEVEYRYLLSRLRRLKGVAIPLRSRSAANPDGVGLEWVKQRFVVEGRTRGRPFIPARLEDNPYLDREDYLQSLNELDPVTRRRLLMGDWEARDAGRYFSRAWFEVVDEGPPRARRARYWDLAATEPKPGRDPDWTTGLLLAEYDGAFWVEDVVRVRERPGECERLIRATAIRDGYEVPVWFEEEPGASGRHLIDHYRRRILQGWNVRSVRHSGSKEVRAQPVASRAEAGLIRLVRGAWIGPFLDELDGFPGTAHDDQVDALSGAWEALARTAGQAPEEPEEYDARGGAVEVGYGMSM